MFKILEFHIRHKSGARHSLEVFERGRSQPLATSTFEYQLSYMMEFEFSRLDFDGEDPAGRFERIKEFGARLHEKLFTPGVQHIWNDAKGESDFLVLCLRVAPDASGLEAVPWETLFDGEEFLAGGR